jgi:hypothetical protein
VGEKGIEHVTVEEEEDDEEHRKPHCQITYCPPNVHSCAQAQSKSLTQSCLSLDSALPLPPPLSLLDLPPPPAPHVPGA